MTPNPDVFYDNAHNAIRDGNGSAPCAIGYKQTAGWFLYNPVTGCPLDCMPELLCVRQGSIPIPLSYEGKLIISQLF